MGAGGGLFYRGFEEMKRIVLKAWGVLGAVWWMVGCGDGQNDLPGPVTFSRDIAPLVFEHCTTCHRPGGWGPFALVDYQDVRQRASQIAEVTQSRFMPPWKPAPGYGEFVGERRLSDAEIKLIGRWVDQGSLEGEPTALPPVPQWPDEWQLGQPDLVVEMPEPYVLPAAGGDVFRNFVLPVPLEAERYVEAVEFRADNVPVIHHAVMMFDRSGAARKHDMREPGLGFDGMVFGEAQRPGGHFLGWTPGKRPYRDPELAWTLAPGTDLVLQLHMLPSGRPEPLTVRVGFYFTDTPPQRVPALLRLGRKDIVIPAGCPAYAIRDTYKLPVAVEVVGIYPHAHYLGKTVGAYALMPDSSKVWLIRIDAWDFNWQDDYRYRRPVPLPKGTTLVMEYVYDNSSENIFNPHEPPRQVFYGLQSSDEMGDLTLQLVTRNAQDLQVLRRDYGRKWLAQETAGYETMLKADPQNAENHHTLAMFYMRTGRAEESLSHLEEALRLAPEYVEARVNLGIALSTRRRFAEAAGHFRRALEDRPGYADAHFNLAMTLHMAGENAAALEHFAQAAQLRPDMAAAIRRQVARLQE